MEEMPTVEEIADDVARSLKGHKRYAHHAALHAFSKDVAEIAISILRVRQKLDDERARRTPAGWQQRKKSASRAIKDLDSSLRKMSTHELQDWVPPSETLMESANITEEDMESPEGLAKYHAAVNHWYKVIAEMAMVVDMRDSLPRPQRRQTASEKGLSAILPLAEAWVRRFSRIPRAAENSPFTTVVRTFYECIDENPPSHPVIRRTLNELNDSLTKKMEVEE